MRPVSQTSGPDLRPTSQPTTPFTGLYVFVVLALLYVVVFWPALRTAWWFRDDYSVGEWGERDRWGMALITGRPVYGLLFYTLPLDNRAEATGFNIGLRLARVLLHVSAAWMLCYLLWRRLRSWLAASAATVPFLVWFLNPDAVLARLGAGYPLSVLLSLCGLLAADGTRPGRGRAALAVVLGSVAVLCNQIGACAGLAAWAILAALEATCPQPEWTRLARQALLAVAGFLLGGLLSMASVSLSPWPAEAGRGGLADDWHDKFRFLVELNDTYLLRCRTTSVAQVALLALVLGTLVVRGLRHDKRLLLAAGALASLTVVPYLTVLVVRESSAMPRTMYLATLLLTGAVAVGFRVLRPSRPALAFGGLLLAAVVAGNVRLGRANAEAYLALQDGDRAALARVEGAARDQGCGRVVLLADYGLVRDTNPYRLRCSQGDNHLSAFQENYSAGPFVRRYSRLPVVDDPEVHAAARRQIESRERPEGMVLQRLHGSDILIVCTP
jgi:hypothetical protein